ncbi:MAG TPA: hypothetical protein VL993_03640, partial [Stellaceae bacterium]|nr:hypothetical protein [Stellaceae bacterium]
ALSVSMELTQYYDVGRDTEVSDAYANTMGAALGGLIGVLFRGDLRLPFLRELSANPVATMLLGAWAAYRLYPYVPAIDLHKYWNALKPVVLRPSVDPLHLFHHLAIWLSGALLIEAIFGLRRAAWLFPLFVGGVLFSEILIVSSLLSVDEIAGALCAYVIFLALAGFGAAPRAAVASIVFAAAVFAERLSPFHFVHATHGFGWIPFYSFMQGSIDIDVMSFFEKFYFYGTMLWLLTRAGIGLRWAAVLVAVGLFASSWVEVYLPGRSAEDTDAIMALMIAAILGLIEHDTEAESRPVPAK